MNAFAAAMLLFVLCSARVRGVPPPEASPPSPAQAPAAAQPDPAAGKPIFEGHCALCHGIDGGGGRGPSLRQPKLLHAADDEALKSVIENGIAPDMPPAWYLSQAEISSVAAYVRSLGKVPSEVLPGNPARGQAIYARNGCSACHILKGEGSGYGPELTEVGARRGSARLRETLQHPTETIPETFLFVKAVTHAGPTILGIRLNEDSFTIQLKDQQGRFYSLRKSELQDLKKLRGETPMPSYGAVLSAAEMDDLVNFLASQKGKP
jgi:cytochrome c oxidase cbb3-type subunit III